VSVLVSVIIPMYNEEENAEDTLAAVGAVLAAEGWTYELVPVDDGSSDGTRTELERLAAADSHVKPVSYRENRGRGYALRRGFAAASGSYVASLDADLSYTADTAVRMVRTLIDDTEADVVLASPYMPGGGVEGVPFVRLALSRAGNVVLRNTLPQRVYTSTGIVRAYRAEVLRSLDLESEGKEIHLEILSEAMALGYRIVEIPAVLATRRKGTSKFRPKSTMASHLTFSLLERSSWVFGIAGFFLVIVGIIIAAYLFGVFLTGELNPERPLMTVMVLLLVGGAVGLSFSLLSLQMSAVRRNVVRLQAEVLRLRSDVVASGAHAPVERDAGGATEMLLPESLAEPDTIADAG